LKKILKSMIISLGISLSVAKPIINELEYDIFDNKIMKLSYHFIANYVESINLSPLVLCLIIFSINVILSKEDNLERKKTYLSQKVVSIFLAIMTLVGRVYVNGIDSIEILFEGVVQSSKSIIILCSWYFIFEFIQLCLINIIERKNTEKKQIIKNANIIKKFETKPFLSGIIVLTIMWTPILLINYPGIVMGDSLQQIVQYLGYIPLRSDNPILSTIIISSFVKIGQHLGSANVGIFLYSIFQSMVMIISLALSVTWVQKITKNPILSTVITLLYGVLPIINGLINVATKDVFFSSFFLFFIVSLCIYLYDPDYYWGNRVQYLTFLSIMLCILFRKNSMYVAVLSIIVIFIIQLSRRTLKGYKFLALCVLSIGTATVINSALIMLTDSNSDTLRRESLSSVFQQTARYARYLDEEVTIEEKGIINKVLNYDKIKKVYNPRISDPVKATHLESATNAEMKQYFKIWIKQGRKHPLIYVESLLNQNYSLFYIEKNPNVYYLYLTDAFRKNNEIRKEYYKRIGLEEIQSVKEIQMNKKYYYKLFDKLPFVSQLNNVAFHIILMLMVFAIALSKKQWKTIILIIPMISLCLSLLAGPVVTGYVRYLVPFVMCSPLILSISLWENREKKKYAKTVANHQPQVYD